MRTDRIVPLIVATALFMENMDATVIATSLPAIAADIGTSPLTLKLAITSYLLSLAIFIPASGWIADRFGARIVFCLAIAVFMLGSIGCALSSSIEHFTIARFVQGIGGAMMTPVARIVLLRTIDKRELVAAMTWVTMPSLIGPMIGPPLGGFITTYFTWHWIFIINIPIGLCGIALAARYIPEFHSDTREPFDLAGMVLAGIGVGGLAFGLSVAGIGIMPWYVVVALVAVGSVSMTLYLRHARHVAAPALDFSLLRIPTLFASVVGGFVFRLGIGAMPFLLPLLLQLGFGLSPFASGLVTFCSVIGAIAIKVPAVWLIGRFGFRNIMVWASGISSLFLASYALFLPPMSLVVIGTVLAIGGFFRSLMFSSINTIAYADVDKKDITRATTLANVCQQVALASGVAIGAGAVEATLGFRQTTEIAAHDFGPAFIALGAISLISTWIFWRMPADAGHEMAGGKQSRLQNERAAAKAAEAAANDAPEQARDNQRL
jgi:EmrB/QacA subfamily drug resistance transporter